MLIMNEVCKNLISKKRIDPSGRDIREREEAKKSESSRKQKSRTGAIRTKLKMKCKL